MTALATTLALAGAAVLLWAGLEKAREPGSPASTLRALGVPPGLAALGVLLIPAELAVGVALVFRPDAAMTHAAVVVLAATFAAAGLVALRRGEAIRCACFGSGRGGYLGAGQVLALVPWIGGAAVLHVAEPSRPPASEAWAMLAGVTLAMAALRLVSILGAWREARGDRRSAQATYVWLRR